MSGQGTPQLSGATTSMANISSRLGTTVLSKMDEVPDFFLEKEGSFPVQKKRSKFTQINAYFPKMQHIFMKHRSNAVQSFLGKFIHF